jgi:hypothetical protein
MTSEPPRRDRLLLAFFAGLLLFALATAAGLTWAVHRAGTLVVEVQGRGDRGDQVLVRVPGILIQTGSIFLRGRELDSLRREIGPYLPAAAEALKRIEQTPDFVLVEVDGPGEKVRIHKQGRHLVIHVDDGEQEVRVLVPLGSARAVLRSLRS